MWRPVTVPHDAPGSAHRMSGSMILDVWFADTASVEKKKMAASQTARGPQYDRAPLTVAARPARGWAPALISLT
jgi:hypothetical protein